MNDARAPYPTGADAVTAGNICRHLVHRADRRIDTMTALAATNGGVTSPHYHAEITTMNLEYAVVSLLHVISDLAGPEEADAAARTLWADWSDGGGVQETLGGWVADYLGRPKP